MPLYTEESPKGPSCKVQREYCVTDHTSQSLLLVLPTIAEDLRTLVPPKAFYVAGTAKQ